MQHIPSRRSPAHLKTLYDTLELIQPQGETGLVSVLHEMAETVRQRAQVIIFSDLFVEHNLLRDCFEHLRFRKHDVSVFHLLDPEELAFAFQRPTRFIDMEGGTAVFADPVEIADRYHRALREYLESLRRVVLETAVDYRRIDISSRYDKELTQFLVDRRIGGEVDEFSATLDACRLAADRSPDSDSSDQPVALPDQALGCDDVSLGRQSHESWVCPDPPMADSGSADAGCCGFDFCHRPPTGQRSAWILRWRANGHDHGLARSVAQHAATRGGRAIQAGDGRRQLSSALQTLGSTHWVAVDGTSAKATAFDSLEGMLDSPAFADSSATADVPKMLESALDYLQKNKPGPTEIWICSDLRTADWNADSGSWSLIRQGFESLPQSVRFHLLAYPDPPRENLTIRVTEARREVVSEGNVNENVLLLSLRLSRSVDESSMEDIEIPIQIEIGGAQRTPLADVRGIGGDEEPSRGPTFQC